MNTIQISSALAYTAAAVLTALVIAVLVLSAKRKADKKRFTALLGQARKEMADNEFQQKLNQSDFTLMKLEKERALLYMQAWFRAITLSTGNSLPVFSSSGGRHEKTSYQIVYDSPFPNYAIDRNYELQRKLESAKFDQEKINLLTEYVPGIVECLYRYRNNYIELLDRTEDIPEFRRLLNFYYIK